MQPLITRAALRRALSPERLAAYACPDDRGEADALARYLWNGALAIALQVSLHALEVTLRNAIYDASKTLVAERFRRRRYVRIDSWLDAEPTFLMPNERDAVERAKERLGSDRRTWTAGHLVAKLTLGFWVALCRKPYDVSRADGPRLWPKLLPMVFPYRPPEVDGREALYLRLEEIRELRNRAAHHDPLWDRDTVGAHARVLETLGWMNPGMVRAVQQIDLFPAVWSVGPEAFRPLAKALLGAVPMITTLPSHA